MGHAISDADKARLDELDLRILRYIDDHRRKRFLNHKILATRLGVFPAKVRKAIQRMQADGVLSEQPFRISEKYLPACRKSRA